jgi:histidine phosphotransfer protein HptB
MSDRAFSRLANDLAMADLVREFVGELPARVAALEHAAADLDWDAIRRLAHQLKGAGGSYGFPAITAAAAVVEKSLGEPESVSRALLRLAEECQKIQAEIDDIPN